jgi:ADP-ribose pyrophosphatase YjhB (NUDIX family)
MKKPVASVDLIIKRKDKILLGKVSDKWSSDGKYEWGLPGREIEFGDDFEKTAEKNLKDELGMKLKSFEVITVNNNFGFGNHYKDKVPDKL